MRHEADLSAMSAAVLGYWFDLHATLSDPRSSQLWLLLYSTDQVADRVGPASRHAMGKPPLPGAAAELIIRAVTHVHVDNDPAERWVQFGGISYDAEVRTLSIRSIGLLELVLSVKAVNVRLWRPDPTGKGIPGE